MGQLNPQGSQGARLENLADFLVLKSAIAAALLDKKFTRRITIGHLTSQ
jgi:hypothetical protein